MLALGLQRKGKRDQHHPYAPDSQSPSAYTSPSSALCFIPQLSQKSSQSYSAWLLGKTSGQLLWLWGLGLLPGTQTLTGQIHPLKPLTPRAHLFPGKPNPSSAEIPYVRVALKALLHKVVEVGGEGTVVGVG